MYLPTVIAGEDNLYVLVDKKQVAAVMLSGWMFAGAGIFALLMALVTVCQPATKATMVNPVKSLQAELPAGIAPE
ncbi:hypothetical protein GA0116948_110146 [Chitinophaga costaii]|uniref:Uncharacterized protein n=2 Tax=Chitinophaga costaii TaxID=1335309 RepID=A0A1C4EZD8_9BACT|nr:hypothetical protein GA0116948_110146 [Chitinophaga costaii]